MKKSEKAALIKSILNEYFPQPQIPLKHYDAFTLLIAVVLSARSTDATVNKITPLLFEKARTPMQMARMPIEEIEKIIKPCGLSPQKSKAIKELSRRIAEEFDHQVPSSFEELESLPGVGHKTASVIMAQAFKIPAFPVDTHIFRCARRWGLSTGSTVKIVEKDLKKIFNQSDWIDLHLQIIYYARTFCPARGHVPAHCPICFALGSKK